MLHVHPVILPPFERNKDGIHRSGIGFNEDPTLIALFPISGSI
jgi:hypothetical protein